MHLSLPTVVILFSFVLVGLPHGVRLLEEDILFHDEDGNVQEGFGRVKRETLDTTELVVPLKFIMKRNLTIVGFTDQEKQTILHMHNAYRSLVRPLASNMIELTWDDEIEAYAQEWANQCTAMHRTNRNLGPWINMGENLYWWYSKNYHEGKSVKWWWDETQYYTYNTKYCVPNELCGHYITMTWAKTEKIGCGIARCERLEDLPEREKPSYYFVCNYSGRFVSNMKPYVATDIPCSSCQTTAYPRCRYNLCVTQEMIDNDIGYNGTTEFVGLTRTETYSSPKTATTALPTTTTEPTTTTLPTTTTEPTTTTVPTTTTEPAPSTTLNPPDPTTSTVSSTHEPESTTDSKQTEQQTTTEAIVEETTRRTGRTVGEIGTGVQPYHSLPLILLTSCLARTIIS